MAAGEYSGPSGFDALFSTEVDVFENIFFSLDYESFKTCSEVNTTWFTRALKLRGRQVI